MWAQVTLLYYVSKYTKNRYYLKKSWNYSYQKKELLFFVNKLSITSSHKMIMPQFYTILLTHQCLSDILMYFTSKKKTWKNWGYYYFTNLKGTEFRTIYDSYIGPNQCASIDLRDGLHPEPLAVGPSLTSSFMPWCISKRRKLEGKRRKEIYLKRKRGDDMWN